MRITLIFIAFLFTSATMLPACSTTGSTGIAVREKLGTPKREQLVDRVDETRDAQESAKEQFASTLDELKSLSGYDGGELESAYKRLKSQLDRAESRADKVRGKIKSVDRVANALFKEWEKELDEYSTDTLRNASAGQLDETRSRFNDVLSAMRKAESKMDPVLAAFNDQVLFLKHNLNARAIASLDSTLLELESEIAVLIADMEASIAEANSFIDEMSSN
jgi:DNA repair exonuclease SbcCD ATPase subunit